MIDLEKPINLIWYGWPNRPCDTKCSDDCPGRSGCNIFSAWEYAYKATFGERAWFTYKYPHSDAHVKECRKFERTRAWREKQYSQNEVGWVKKAIRQIKRGATKHFCVELLRAGPLGNRSYWSIFLRINRMLRKENGTASIKH